MAASSARAVSMETPDFSRPMAVSWWSPRARAGIRREWQEQLEVRPPIEVRRQHADDCVWPAVQGDRAVEDVRVGTERPFP